MLVHQTLSHRTGSPRLALPDDLYDWAQALSREWIDEIEQRGYDVVGDLDDLVPAGAPPHFSDPDQPELEAINEASLDTIEALLLEGVRLRESEEALHEQVRELEEALQRSYLRPSYRIRERAVRKMEDSNAGQGVMKTYRRLRGR